VCRKCVHYGIITWTTAAATRTATSRTSGVVNLSKHIWGRNIWYFAACERWLYKRHTGDLTGHTRVFFRSVPYWRYTALSKVFQTGHHSGDLHCVLLGLTPCSLVGGYQYFGGICNVHPMRDLQSWGPRGNKNVGTPITRLWQFFVISLTTKNIKQNKKNSEALGRQLTIPTERPPLVGEVSANFSGYRVSRGQRNESPRPLISVF
jgi:hypothetical protein